MAAPVPAFAEEDFPLYTGDQLNELFTNAPLDRLAPIGPAPSITGSSSVDARIRDLAEARGYLRRPVARAPLGRADGHPIQPEAAKWWNALQAEARRSGFAIRIVSGYRDIATQRTVFNRSLTGYSYSAINARLRWVAAPGYSKHHTGYAMDITQSGYDTSDFVNSGGWAWLSANNNYNAKRFGFIPSYPGDAHSQGPEPEPWEWTYIGVDVARCGGFNLGWETGVAAANPSGSLWDLETCAGLPLTRGAAAFYLASALKLPVGAEDAFVDDDGTAYEDSIEAVAEAGITTGCGPTEERRFCPTDYVTRAQIAAFLTRALDLPSGNDAFVDDSGSTFETAINAIAAAGITHGCNPPANDRFCPDDLVTRGQLLSFLDQAVDLPQRPEPTAEEATANEHNGKFTDDDNSVFEEDIEWLAADGITSGCNPPAASRYCPDDPVTRGQMAAFLNRALQLEAAEAAFADTTDSLFRADIGALATAGITRGCNPPHNDRFCPDDPVTRGQMAAFLVRALNYTGNEGPDFGDDNESVFEKDIQRLAAASITRGCNPPHNDRFCPDDPITRGQIAAFLHRALGD